MVKYLDGEDAADTTKHWPPQQWRIEALLQRRPGTVRWRLTSGINFDGAKIPGRQVLRDVCGWRYRRWDGSGWNYTDAQCPYRGTKYFDANDNPVTEAAQDVCSRRLDGCKARFGSTVALPFGGFVGLGRNR